MENDIPQRQNTLESIRLLAAQRRLYTKAKCLLLLEMCLSVPVVIVFSALVCFLPQLKVYAACYAVILAILCEYLLSDVQRRWRREAAVIQEVFDCEVLQLPWNAMHVGKKPQLEDIIKAADDYSSPHPDRKELRNWYPVAVGELSLAVARFICQRANIFWDSAIRTWYRCIVLAILAILLLVLSLFALSNGLTVENFLLAVVVPAMPAILLGIRQAREQGDAIDRLDRLRDAVNDCWREIINGKLAERSFTDKSRLLQDEIFSHRGKSGVIFDWVYRRLKNKCEDVMNKTAEGLVAEARKNAT